MKSLVKSGEERREKEGECVKLLEGKTKTEAL